MQQMSSPSISISPVSRAHAQSSMEEQKVSTESVSQFGRQKVDKLFGSRMLGLKFGDKGRPLDGQPNVRGQRLKFLELVQAMQEELDVRD